MSDSWDMWDMFGSPSALRDAGLAALAAHYGYPEAHFIDAGGDGCEADAGDCRCCAGADDRDRVPLARIMTMLVVALDKLTMVGLDDAAFAAIDNGEAAGLFDEDAADFMASVVSDLRELDAEEGGS